MISVELCRSESGEFVSCRAHGHAEFDMSGKDIVCSAVTVLLRTAAQVLAETEAVDLSIQAGERGLLAFAAAAAEQTALLHARLVCVADFLEKGLGALSADFPKNVKVATVISKE